MMRTLKYAGLGLVSLFFVIGGQAHFTSTAFFVSIVPPYVPLPLLTVYVTGLIEIIGAVAIWVPAWRWVTWGSAIAGAIWIAGSLLLSWYVANFGTYNATYGSLGAMIGFMVWIWLSTIVILVGGEINAEIEHQTASDTTEGQTKPMGARGARMADELGSRRA